MDNLTAEVEQLKALHFSKNDGQSAAFLAGFRAAADEYVVTLGSDLQVDPEDLFKMIPYLDDYDMVVGVRKNRNDTLKKRISTLITNKVKNFIKDESISDTGCPLKDFQK